MTLLASPGMAPVLLQKYLRTEAASDLPPPHAVAGPVAWVQKNLFSDWQSVVLTLLGGALAAWAVYNLLDLFLFSAIFSGTDGTPCRAPDSGMCWPFIVQKMPYFMYGSYPVDQRWRVDIFLVAGAVMIFWLLWDKAPRKDIAAGLFFIVYPIVSFCLLSGLPAIGLRRVDTNDWGGIFVSLLMSLVGIVFSLPLGVLLALGRRSKLPIIKVFCVVFIEFLRGVPFITVLFMAVRLLPLFVPYWLQPDKLLLPLIGTVMFASAYMAEVVRGGLQAMPKGQFEGAMAMGLGYGQMMRLVILPQSLTMVIPGIVNTFIGLFKDTTLVVVVGVFDFLQVVVTAGKDLDWAGPRLLITAFTFAAMFYWVFCFGMSRYSLYMERKLSVGKQR